jgi:hypothetical protein
MADSSGIAALTRAARKNLSAGMPHQILTGPAPCDACRLRQKCAAERLACDRYVMFFYGRPQWRWERAPLVPTRAKFEALFD